MQQKLEGFFALFRKPGAIDARVAVLEEKQKALEKKKAALEKLMLSLENEFDALCTERGALWRQKQALREPEKEQQLKELIKSKIQCSVVDVDLARGCNVKIVLWVQHKAYDDIKKAFNCSRNIQVTKAMDPLYNSDPQLVIHFPYDELSNVLRGLQLSEGINVTAHNLSVFTDC